MRWEDERYVRFYTRDTPEFSALSWHARGLFGLIMRKVDRAGILPLGRLGLKGVAVAVQGPWAEIEGPLAELLDDGCAYFDQERGVLLLRNFIEAQEARQSDRARKQASRERARSLIGGSTTAAEAARSVLADGQNVTIRDPMPSHNVTESHDRSHDVTRGHTESLCAVPCCAVPSRTVHSAREDAPAERTEPKAKTPRAKATRIPEGWKPSDKVLEWARTEGIRNPLEPLDEFVDFWRSASGPTSAKADWDATYRNRLRNLVDQGRLDQRKPVKPPAPPPAKTNGAPPVTDVERKAIAEKALREFDQATLPDLLLEVMDLERGTS